MASLRRLPGSRYFIGCFTDHTGKRIQRSTKSTSRQAAMKIVMEWEGVTRAHATSAQFQRVLSAMHASLHGAPLAAPTLRTYAAQWFEHKARTTREVSLRNYKVAVNDFVEAVGDAADKPIHFITTGTITAWQNASADRASNRTALNKLKIVRTLFQSAWREGHLPDGNPAAKVEALKKEESTRRPFTLPELKRVLKACGGGPWRGMVLLGLYTGQRLKDLASLTWRAVNLEENEINLTTSKTGRAQSIPIAPPLRAFLVNLEAGDDPDQPLFSKLHPLAVRAGGTSALSQAFHGILCDAGLATPWSKQSTGKGRSAPRTKNAVTFHSLRHTATTLLKKAGASEAVAMDLIGHDSKAVSANYTHVDAASKRAAIAKLPDITV